MQALGDAQDKVQRTMSVFHGRVRVNLAAKSAGGSRVQVNGMIDDGLLVWIRSKRNKGLGEGIASSYDGQQEEENSPSSHGRAAT